MLRDVFDRFFKLYAVKREVAAAICTNYANVAANAQHLKGVAFAGMRFFHGQQVANLDFHDLHVSPPSKINIYTIIIPYSAKFVNGFSVFFIKYNL